MKTISIILATALNVGGGFLINSGHGLWGGLSLVVGAFLFGWLAGVENSLWYADKEGFLNNKFYSTYKKAGK